MDVNEYRTNNRPASHNSFPAVEPLQPFSMTLVLTKHTQKERKQDWTFLTKFMLRLLNNKNNRIRLDVFDDVRVAVEEYSNNN